MQTGYYETSDGRAWYAYINTSGELITTEVYPTWFVRLMSTAT